MVIGELNLSTNNLSIVMKMIPIHSNLRGLSELDISDHIFWLLYVNVSVFQIHISIS